MTGDGGPVHAGDGVARRPRWRPGERLELLFEQHCDRLAESGSADRIAIDAGRVRLSFGELDTRANRLARYLLTLGVAPGDRVGLLFDDAVPACVGMLAVLKVNAVYVPLDVSFPDDRLAHIVRDAGVRSC